MHADRRAAMLFVIALLSTGTLDAPRNAAAQTAATPEAPVPPVTPMTPSAPHERLSFFLGTWTIAEFPEEDGFRETCDWLSEGRRHMICRSTWKTKTGPREGLSIFSYRAADSAYVYQGFRPGGAVQTLLGSVSDDGQTWEFHGAEGSGASRVRTRVKISPASDGMFRFVEQSATGDGEWSAEEVVHYRAAPAATR